MSDNAYDIDHRRRAILQMPEPIHPGEYVREEVLPNYRLSPEGAANLIGVEYSYLQALMNETVDLTVEAAIGLGNLDGSGPWLWMDLQVAYTWWNKLKGRETRIS
jgi:addiction module HigA family antidote